MSTGKNPLPNPPKPMRHISSVPGRSAAKHGGLVTSVTVAYLDPLLWCCAWCSMGMTLLWMGNLCYESNKGGLQIGEEIPRSDHKTESGLQRHTCTENILYFYFSVKEEQKPVQTSPHYGFQRRLGRTVAWRYNDLLTENKAKITFCSQAVL